MKNRGYSKKRSTMNTLSYDRVEYNNVTLPPHSTALCTLLASIYNITIGSIRLQMTYLSMVSKLIIPHYIYLKPEHFE